MPFTMLQTRLELARVAPYAPQAYVSAYSTTGAMLNYYSITPVEAMIIHQNESHRIYIY